jgi:hypothetical protein
MKKLIAFLLFLAVVVAAIPGAAYWIGMDNMEGPPAPPDKPRYLEFQAREVWAARQEAWPPTLKPVTPWHFYHLVWCSRHDRDIEDFLSCDDEYPGLRAAGYVAKRHLDLHLKQRGLIWRYLSRTALTIWISRHWSKEELVAELIRLKHVPPASA